jgi:hypothetical protein
MKSNVVIIPNISFRLQSVVGVMWDRGQNTPNLTRLTPANDPNGYVNKVISTEPVAAVGTGAGSSPFDNIAPWNGMKIYSANANGDILNEIARPITSAQDNIDLVVRVPAFWFKVVNSGNVTYYYISEYAKAGFKKHKGSDKYVARYATTGSAATPTTRRGLAHAVSATRAQFRTGAANKGSKWHQYDWNTYSALCLLMAVEFASWDSQAKIGEGYTNSSNSAQINSGSTDAMTYHTGRPTTGANANQNGVQWRGIENLWGNIWQFVDGINFNDRAVYVADDPAQFADDVISGAYAATGVTMPAASGQYITDTANSDDENWLIPTGAGGSNATYVPDYFYNTTGLRVLLVGGYWNYDLRAGARAFLADYVAALTGTDFGSRLVVKSS